MTSRPYKEGLEKLWRHYVKLKNKAWQWGERLVKNCMTSFMGDLISFENNILNYFTFVYFLLLPTLISMNKKCFDKLTLGNPRICAIGTPLLNLLTIFNYVTLKDKGLKLLFIACVYFTKKSFCQAKSCGLTAFSKRSAIQFHQQLTLQIKG